MFAPNMRDSAIHMLKSIFQSSVHNFTLSSMAKFKCFCVISCIFALIPSEIYAQPVTTDKAREISSDTLATPDSTHNDLLADLFDNDTIEVVYVRYGNLMEVLPFDDSLINANLRHIDPARTFSPNLFTLGNFGAPSISPLVRPVDREAFDIGQHSHDAYDIRFDNFRFYRPKTPYTHVRYGTTTGQRDDNIFTGKISRSFAKNLTFNLEYNRINQVGDFLRDKTRNTNLGVGFEQSHWKNRFKTHLIYTYNQYLREENGGLQEYTVDDATGAAGARLNMPVFISAGGSKMRSWGILLNNDLALFKGGDSLSRLTSDKGLHLGYEVSFVNRNGLFYDTDSKSTLDTFYYKGLNTDSRGIRNSFVHKVFKNTVYLSAVGNGDKLSVGQTNFLKGGLTYERHQLEYLPTDSSFSLLKLIGSGHWDLANVVGVSANGYYLLNSLEPIFNLEGKLSGQLKKIFDVEAWLQLSNNGPEFMQQHLNLNSRRVYDRSGKNIFHTYFGGRINIPFVGLDVSLHQNIIQNYTYFDDNLRMQQLTDAVSVTGLQAKYNLKLGVFHFDNDVLWQATSDPTVRIPTWTTNHSVYLEAKLFRKKLLINAGVDVRYLSQFDRLGYNPLISNFYNTNSDYKSDMLTYDVFLSYKVRLLRGFVRVDNINNIYDKRGQYQIDRYPIDAFAIRLGFDWIFNN